MLDLQDVRELAETLGCPIHDVLALAPNNDPFYAERNGRRIEAEWFADVCKQLGLGAGLHVRRVHYRASISPPVPILKPDGTPYQNIQNDWMLMVRASRDARYLGLVPGEWFIDRRNPNPIINTSFRPWEPSPRIEVSNTEGLGELAWLPSKPELPQLSLEDFVAQQRYLIELWIEKTTIHDILEPLARRYGINLIAFSGEGSETACRAAIKRAQGAKRPLHIIYLSDFDPGGRSMPVAIARKIEYWLNAEESDLRVTLDPIVLVPEQVEHYRLPRNPIKETERRGAKFEENFGAGAVELDALEALHPGELRKIVEEAVLRYIDPDLRERQEAAAEEIESDLREIEERVYRPWNREIGEITTRYTELRKELVKLREEATELWEFIAHDLEQQSLHVDKDEIPTAPEADQEAPLFDSKRDYVTQLDWYRHWQRRAAPGSAP